MSLDQVDSGDRFGDRVLDLEAGVRFDEGEVAACIVVRAAAIAVGNRAVGGVSGFDQELERAQAVVLRGPAQAQRRVDDRAAQGRGEVRRRRRLDHFLVPALGAALTFAEVDQPAAFVAEELDFDVPCPRDQLLDIEAAVAERALGLGPAALVRLFDLLGRGDDAGPAPAAAGERLDDHRAAVFESREELSRFVETGGPIRAAQDGDIGGGGGGTGSALVAEEFQHLEPRADEGDARVGAGSAEGCVLGQETVAGMDRVAVCFDRSAQDILDVEIRRHAATTERDRLIGDPQVQPVRVVLGVDGYSLDSEIHRRAGDPYRDLAAVRDEQAAHRLRRRAVSGFGAEGCALGPHLLQLL